MMKKVFSISIAAIIVLISGQSLGQKAIDKFGDWTAFYDGSGKKRSCYIASLPQKQSGKYKSRGATGITITHRMQQNTKNIIEIRAGYTYRKDSEVEIKIDGKPFLLFTNSDSAWAYDKEDSKIVRSMVRGKSMIVTGFSSRGTKTVDTYSLLGFTQAHRSIGKSCGLK